jgi:hypothetical protein
MRVLKPLDETLHEIPPFFFLENKSIKTTKICYTGKEKSSPSMYGKGKLDLREIGLPLPRQKSSRPTCFVCHSYEIPTEISQDNKRNYIGIEKNGSITNMQSKRRI